MAISLSPTRLPGTTARVAAPTDLATVLTKAAAALAAASGVIHLAVVRHHLDYGMVAAGFTLMGAAQLFLAVALLTRPWLPLRLAGVLVHAAIIATWLLSRTVGLAVVPGAEDPAPFGLADSIANGLALGLIAALVAGAVVDRRPSLALFSMRIGRGVVATTAVAAFALAIPAALASHDHSHHSHTVDHETVPQPGVAPTADGHDDHHHDHG